MAKRDWAFRGGLVLAVAGAFAPDGAKAGGFEFSGAGVRAIGRGGAYAARADDPMALLYNPANLAGTEGIQLHASNSFIFHSNCFDRDGTYGHEEYDNPDPTMPGPQSRLNSIYENNDTMFGPTTMYDGIDMPEVCQNNRVNFVPELAFSWRINERLGIGIGVVAPTAPGHLRYGKTINGRQGMVRINDTLALPAPTRYGLIEMQALIAYPTIGIGYAVHPRFRVGASFGSGFGIFEFTNISSPFFGEQFSTDILTEVKVHDYFIPRVTLSAHAEPIDGLDVMASMTFQGDINGRGSIDLTAQYYLNDADRAAGNDGRVIPYELSLDGMKLNAGNPWQLQFGIRYASRIEGAVGEGRIADSMQTERWDVELDLGYEINSRLRAFEVQIPDDPETGERPFINVRPPSMPGGVGLPAGIPPELPDLLHRWKNQLTIRVGGDYNVVPGTFSLRGGVSFETNGQRNGYQQFDFQPWQRTGIHTGLTVRVGRTDLSLAYAHFFTQSQTVRPLAGCPRDLVAGGACEIHAESDTTWGVRQLVALQAFGATAINTGRFKTHTDIVTAGLTYHFR